MKVPLSKLTALIDELLAEGSTLLGAVKTEERRRPAATAAWGNVLRWHRWTVEVFDVQQTTRWSCRCAHLAGLLEPLGAPWAGSLKAEIAGSDDMRRLMGALEAAKGAIRDGLLVSLQDLVVADMFHDLLEQAEYLLANEYYLAAGVLGRAVLEGHLRKWCAWCACSPLKARGTINDYNAQLYGAKRIDKITMKHIEALAAIGNDAAHCSPELTRDAVARLLRDIREFLAKQPRA